MSASILIVDDERGVRTALSMLLDDRYDVYTAASGTEALREFKLQEPDLVLLDIGLPDANGLDILKKIKEDSPDTGVIMITAFGEAQQIVEAVKQGAYDYLVKPLDNQELQLTVSNCLKHSRLTNHLHVLQKSKSTLLSKFFRSKGSAMLKVYELVDKVATSTNTPVLLTGETGSGKGMLAQTIHHKSLNSDSPFITVNCGAISRELVESELFGYARGAFTGARAGGKKGRFEEAADGTLFLDEIGVMPIDAQSKILSVLEDRSFYRVGGNRKRTVDARIIAATNLNLEEAVTNGNFRRDLFFRLNVISIAIPPLRKRPEDILPLFQYFINQSNLETGKTFSTITQEAQTLLMEYEWPGNVRELRNLAERITLLENGDIIHPEFFPFAQSPSHFPSVPLEQNHNISPAVDDLDYDKAMRRILKQALKKSDGNITLAAKLLKMAPHKLRYRIKKTGLAV